jgi:hypothetical protein
MKFQQIQEGLGQDADHMEQDHEVQMARADCFHAAKNAIELHRILKNISERQGLEGWVSEKITLAADYLRTVKEYLEYETMDRSDEFDIGPKAEYEDMFGQAMYESQKSNKKYIKENETETETEKKISTPGLNARARALLIKAYGMFPQAESDISALVNYLSYLESNTGRDVTRLDSENRDQDRDINRLDKENNREESQLDMLTQEVRALRDQLTAMTKQGVRESKHKKKSIKEMSAGATGSGSVAAVASPLMPGKKSKSRPVKEGFPLLAAVPAVVGAVGSAALRNPRMAATIGGAIAKKLMPDDNTEAEAKKKDDLEDRQARAAAAFARYEPAIASLERQLKAEK